MLKLGKFYYITGVFLMIVGLVSGYFGYYKMLSYLRLAQSAEDVSVGLFAFGLIVPHIMVFAGMGGTVFGLIWIIRGLMLSRKLSDDR